MARGAYETHVASDPVRLTKVFYVLRPLLACRWIVHTGAQPPTEFDRLASADWVSVDELTMIARLTEAKADASESHRTPLDPSTREWFEQELAAAEQASTAIRSTATIETRVLNELLRRSADVV